jgi:hypothetical protein
MPEELDIPVIVDAYNKHKVGVDIADQCHTYFDTQFIFRRNWYPLFYCIPETALINSLIISRGPPANNEHTVDHFDFRLSIVHDLLQVGSPSIMKSSSHIPASQKITPSPPPTQYVMCTCIVSPTAQVRLICTWCMKICLTRVAHIRRAAHISESGSYQCKRMSKRR